MAPKIDYSWQLFYEDIPVGTEGECLGRTIRYCDIINYANYTRDYQEIHANSEFAKSSLYGEVILHGLAGISYVNGMLLRTEFGTRTLRTMLACLGYKSIKFTLPIKVGDTITVHYKVVDKTDVDDTKGTLEMYFEAVNQRGEVVSKHYRTYLFAKRGYDFETIAQRGEW